MELESFFNNHGIDSKTFLSSWGFDNNRELQIEERGTISLDEDMVLYIHSGFSWDDIYHFKIEIKNLEQLINIISSLSL